MSVRVWWGGVLTETSGPRQIEAAGIKRYSADTEICQIRLSDPPCLTALPHHHHLSSPFTLHLSLSVKSPDGFRLANKVAQKTIIHTV